MATDPVDVQFTMNAGYSEEEVASKERILTAGAVNIQQTHCHFEVKFKLRTYLHVYVLDRLVVNK